MAAMNGSAPEELRARHQSAPLESGPLVDPSTAATEWVDEVETGWTGQHDRGVGLTTEMKITTLPR